MTEPLDWLARRVEADPFFLGSVLALYAQSERLDDAGLAAALGCPTDLLPKLKLCRPPRTERVWEDVSSIAAHFGLGTDRLAVVVRRGQVLAQLRGIGSASGTLLAARDREKAPEGEGRAPP